jgi:hypothetical protein
MLVTNFFASSVRNLTKKNKKKKKKNKVKKFNFFFLFFLPFIDEPPADALTLRLISRLWRTARNAAKPEHNAISATEQHRVATGTRPTCSWRISSLCKRCSPNGAPTVSPLRTRLSLLRRRSVKSLRCSRALSARRSPLLHLLVELLKLPLHDCERFRSVVAGHVAQAAHLHCSSLGQRSGGRAARQARARARRLCALPINNVRRQPQHAIAASAAAAMRRRRRHVVVGLQHATNRR